MLDRARAGLEALGVTPAAVGARLEDFQPRLPCAAVLAAHVIEHCDDPEAAFRRFAGWLEPGGRLYLIASKPHWCNWLIWLRFRHRWFSESQVRQAAAAAGICHDLTHVFDAGPPSRTSLGYIFSKP
jgi:2-polyprenyl-3-methyl-5-hydroxy-6-metoxy-1,4-benzoquinol methylase